MRANTVSHSNIKTPRRQLPNLQMIKLDGAKARVCSTCRRTMAKKAA
jgi:ribosomal protein L28